MDLSRTYNICKGSYWKCEDPITETLFTWGSEFDPLPYWFFPILYSGYECFNFYFIPGAVGTFIIPISGQEGYTGNITINVSECGGQYDKCPEDEDVNITWLNPEGGWQTYVFQGLRFDGYDQGKITTFKDTGRVLKFVERIGVYETHVCETLWIPKTHIDYLDTLRYGAIQAWLFNVDTSNYDIPIIVEATSFTKYGSRDQLFKATVKYRLSTEINIQGQ